MAVTCGPKMREELVLCVEGDDWEREFLEGRSRQGRQGNSGDGGFDNGGREILNWDVREWDAVNDFLKLKMDISILGFVGGGILELWA